MKRLLQLGIALGLCTLVVEIALVRMAFAPVPIEPYDVDLPAPATHWEGSKNVGPKITRGAIFVHSSEAFGSSRKNAVVYHSRGVTETDGLLVVDHTTPVPDCATPATACDFAQVWEKVQPGDTVELLGNQRPIDARTEVDAILGRP